MAVSFLNTAALKFHSCITRFPKGKVITNGYIGGWDESKGN